MSDSWRPSAAINTLVQRAELLQRVRSFFRERNIVEVQTPTLDTYGVTDVAIENVEVAGYGYLQSSPEYQMKRLLVAGMPSCYQIGPAFRAGEQGRWHNVEFTMLEWYQLGITLDALMSDVAALVDVIVGPAPVEKVTVSELLKQQFEVDAQTTEKDQVLAVAQKAGLVGCDDVDVAIDYLLSDAIAKLRASRVFLHDYPVSMAALAKTVTYGQREVARRFELIVDGLEIANGYDELQDADEFLRRCALDNEKRIARGLNPKPIDSRFVRAMREGLPDCCGVAVGLDRLFTIALERAELSDVLAFARPRE